MEEVFLVSSYRAVMAVFFIVEIIHKHILCEAQSWDCWL